MPLWAPTSVQVHRRRPWTSGVILRGDGYEWVGGLIKGAIGYGEQLGVHPEALRNWIRQDRTDLGGRFDRPMSAEADEFSPVA